VNHAQTTGDFNMDKITRLVTNIRQ
jgi:hypothetical protein